MRTLTVDSQGMATLAKPHEEASVQALQAAHAADGIASKVERSHGVFSGHSSARFADMEQIRRHAAVSIAAVGSELAAKLRAAGYVYARVDDSLSANLDK
ncbi:ESX-1 secretion-associated protein [Mycobacterium ahvazicum]|uniref:ESX-1 secretion-associated protein n=1 Tax=Mycobacterium ahvazicum TaxID=1964395 RepID=A0A2K4YGJ0_9MYCO|nr:ESX-1 secretion-associated protein [Mycobacterium ahvazicum]